MKKNPQRPFGKKEISKASTIMRFIKRYFLYLFFVGCLGFVSLIFLYKFFHTKPTYLYARVKVGQGLWWANTQKPNIWLVKGIERAKESKDLSGKPSVQVLDVVYYPYAVYPATGQYDVYVTVKLKVTPLRNKDTYNFNREIIGIGSPIYLEFPNVQFAGTVTMMSMTPFTERYVTKTVYLTKRSPLPWEYDQIRIGDIQTNGKQTVLEVLDKFYNGEMTGTSTLSQGWLVNTNINLFTVKVRLLVKEMNGQYIFGEEQIVAPSKYLMGAGTKQFTFNDYYITMVE